MSYNIADRNQAIDLAGKLLDVKAVRLKVSDPFTWSSGWKSPIYCDNRITLSYPSLRTGICSQFAEIVKNRYPQADAVAGVATAGIPQGALLADRLELPFLYVRSKPKGHGMENLIEGRLEPGMKVVVVEDLISTGGSSLKAIESMRAAGAEVLGLLAIFNYGFETARENCSAANVEVTWLSDYPSLIELAQKRDMFSDEDLNLLEQWRKDPGNWGR